MRERSHAGFHNGRQHDASTRPKQLRNREVPWEGSHRSKLMSRRTERPYKVDGAGELARHSAARGSTPEINGPVVQQEFTFLLRETCSSSPSATVGATASNGLRTTAGVSRGYSSEADRAPRHSVQRHVRVRAPNDKYRRLRDNRMMGGNRGWNPGTN